MRPAGPSGPPTYVHELHKVYGARVVRVRLPEESLPLVLAAVVPHRVQRLAPRCELVSSYWNWNQ